MRRAMLSLLQGSLVIVLAVSAVAASAGQELAGRMTERMTTELSLTPDQVTKVQEINATHLAGMQELMGKYLGNAQQGWAQDARTLRDRRDVQLHAVLTAEQWQTYEANKPARSAEFLTEIQAAQLDLTEAQIPPVESINLTATTRIQALRAQHPNAAELPRQEKAQLAKTIKAALDQRDQDLKRVLTSGQWKTYSKAKEQMRALLQERIDAAQAG